MWAWRTMWAWAHVPLSRLEACPPRPAANRETRRPGQPRECVLVWDPVSEWFTDPCDEGVEVPADGGDLETFPTRVDESGNIIVSLKRS